MPNRLGVLRRPGRARAARLLGGRPGRRRPGPPAAQVRGGHALPAPDRRRQRDRRPPRPAGGGGVLVGQRPAGAHRPAGLYRSLEERFRGRVAPRSLEQLLGTVPAGARPHHNFHVFQTYLRTGTLPAGLDTLEQCRVGWGTVLTADAPPGRGGGPDAGVAGRRARPGGAGAAPPRPQPGRLHRLPRPGPWAIWWPSTGGGLRARLSPHQGAALERETRRHLALANRTL